jgi:hypothetical protein
MMSSFLETGLDGVERVEGAINCKTGDAACL